MPSDPEPKPEPSELTPTSFPDAGMETSRRRVGPEGLEFLAPPQMPDELGRLAQFRILKKLGSGGMGVVLLAEDTSLGRHVALKVMRGAALDDPTARSRFLREARAAAAFKHDNIVTIYQVGEDAGVPFIAMELLQGESLEHRLMPGQSLPLLQIVTICRQVAEGLSAAHAKGLIHRDIKPANVWLESPSGRVKILDFGLARSAMDEVQLTGEGQMLGTPAYMSPEQGCGAAVDHRSDLFSLGAMMYRMCAGETPFRGDSVMALLTALAIEEPTPVRSRNNAVPLGLADLIHCLLSKDPITRPASAKVVADWLRKIEQNLAAGRNQPERDPSGWSMVGHSQIVDPATTLVPPGSRWKDAAESAAGESAPRRWPRVAAAIAVLLAVGFAAWAVVDGRSNNNDDQGGAVALKTDPPALEQPRPEPPKPEPVKVEPPMPAVPDGEAGIAPMPREVAVVPDPAPTEHELERAAAAALLPRAYLKVRFANDQAATLRRGGTLPAEPFALVGVEMGDFEYPADYAQSVLLPALARLRSLKSLLCESVPMSEAEMARLADMPFAATLAELQGRFSLTASTLDALKRMPAITSLSCSAAQADDAVLEKLSEFPRLAELSLSELNKAAGITRKSVKAIARLPFKSLSLRLLHVPVDSTIAELFAAMPQLEELDLFEADVSDEVLPVLARSKSLVKLNLSGTKVTDAGLKDLGELTTLRELELNRTAVSNEGAAQLAKSLPLCKIWWADSKFINPKSDLPPP